MPDSKTIVARLGGPSEVARLCGSEITPQAVSQWYGTDAHGKERDIPTGWRKFLMAIRPEVFSDDYEPEPKAA